MESKRSLQSPERKLMSGFTQAQVEQLTRLRNAYIEKEQRQMLEEQRRLEFARWLVDNGRLTDGFPTT